ncbi:MAG: molybdopterin-dependent oxidoreductase, partial [Alphaproteobacteria bacterium]|nr:molybdopterin-dependent oxidoreductase [Alphaproteobacteria bacterium]
MKFGIGQPVVRVEDARFVTGRGRYADDRQDAGLLHAVFVRSPFAHAHVGGFDTAEAKAAPGVVAVLTGADWAAEGLPGLPVRSQPTNRDGTPGFLPRRDALASDTVRHVGEAVAVVIAESRAAAEDAAELVAVDYAEIEPVADPRAALADDAPAIHAREGEGAANLSFAWGTGDDTAVEDAFARAAHVTRLTVVQNRIAPNPMEPRGCLALVEEDGRLTLTGAIQGVYAFRDLLCGLFGWDKAKLHVKAEDVGGGFGGKNQVQ